MLNWVSRFNIFCLLDNNGYQFEKPSFEWMLATDAGHTFSASGNDIEFEALQSYHESNPGWLFGHFNYPSANRDNNGFPACFFFKPGILLSFKDDILHIETEGRDAAAIFQEINEQDSVIQKNSESRVSIQNRSSRDAYIEMVRALKRHIQRGDCYEINICQEFYSTDASIDPLWLFKQLTEASPNPFASFYRVFDQYCLCASPERFLKKTGTTLISQPIKGTSKRDLQNIEQDIVNKEYLLNSAKEKSENVMVVDLVRNDLSRICTEGSVSVKELFGIYSFPQVHQMISTIQGSVDENMHWTKMIEACFPMGSMTGAPKVKVMELIDKYEGFPRGLFSGTIGYVTPGGDFDFNVVIRSLFYDASNKILSLKAGSGITFYSDPALEYEECLVKASAIINMLEKDQERFFLPPAEREAG